MKKILLFTFCVFFISAHAQQWQWAKKADSTTAKQVAKKICSDNSGNVFALGYNQGKATYGNAILDSGSFIVKYDSIGILVWAKHIEGNPIDISCDATGNLYVLANFYGNINVGSFALTSHGSCDFYLAKLSSLGSLFWVKSFGGFNYDQAYSFAVDNKSNSYITGLYNDSILFGNIHLKDSTGTNFSNFFLVKIDSTGNIQWANSGPQNFASSTNGFYQSGTCVRLNKAQDIYVMGQERFPYDSYFYYFLMKYNTSGNFQLNITPGGGDWSVYAEKDFVIDDSSNIYHIWNSGTHYENDPELIKYDSLLNIKWQKGLSDWDYYHKYFTTFGLSVDGSGNIYLAGALGNGYLQGDSIQLCNQWLIKKGGYDFLIGKFSKSGSCLWYKTAGGTNETISNQSTLHIDNKGNCYAMGAYYTSVCCNTSNDTFSFDNHVLTNDGNWSQVFVAKLSSGLQNVCPPPSIPTASNAIICANQTVSLSATGSGILGWYSQAIGGIYLGGGANYITSTLTTNTTFYVQDSTCAASTTRKEVLVTVNPLPTVSATATATTVCAGTSVTLSGTGASSYTWSGGVTNGVGVIPSATTTYTVTGIDANGCSNTATKTINVNPLPDLTTNLSGATITANQSGALYQWLDCNNGLSPIAGETNQSYTPLINGNYAVIVTMNTCSDTSASVNFNTTGIDKTRINNNPISIYPNPANSQINVEINKYLIGSTFTITDILGKTAMTGKLVAEKTIIEIDNLSRGFYSIRIGNNSKQTFRVIKN